MSSRRRFSPAYQRHSGKSVTTAMTMMMRPRSRSIESMRGRRPTSVDIGAARQLARRSLQPLAGWSDVITGAAGAACGRGLHLDTNGCHAAPAVDPVRTGGCRMRESARPELPTARSRGPRPRAQYGAHAALRRRRPGTQRRLGISDVLGGCRWATAAS